MLTSELSSRMSTKHADILLTMDLMELVTISWNQFLSILVQIPMSNDFSLELR